MSSPYDSLLVHYAPYMLLLGAVLLMACGLLLFRVRRRLGGSKASAAPQVAAPRREREVAVPPPPTVVTAPPPAAIHPAGPAGAPPQAERGATATPKPTPTVVLEPAPTQPKVADAPAPHVVDKKATDADAAAAERAALAGGLEKTRAGLWGRLRALFVGATKLDDALLEDIEDVLLTSDVGVGMTDLLLEMVKEEVAGRQGTLDADGLKAVLAAKLTHVLLAAEADAARPTVPLSTPPTQGLPKVVLFVGVNGVGKTTTVGKVAHLLGQAGQKVVMAAGDTFRAAAAEQLAVWAERTGSRLVRGEAGADPASVMFNAVAAAKADGADVVLADTAGRLHTQNDLMAEVHKVGRAIGRLRPGAPDETWLVVDATTGQNALHQARAFHQAVGLTGVVLTKLDGTAKGGVIFALARELKLPIRYVGLGERAELLQPFDAAGFVEALLQ